jgi:hypothetical protein
VNRLPVAVQDQDGRKMERAHTGDRLGLRLGLRLRLRLVAGATARRARAARRVGGPKESTVPAGLFHRLMPHRKRCGRLSCFALGAVGKSGDVGGAVVRVRD